jgi:hypothetical protein
MGATVARGAAGVESELRTWHRATIGRDAGPDRAAGGARYDAARTGFAMSRR